MNTYVNGITQNQNIYDPQLNGCSTVKASEGLDISTLKAGQSISGRIVEMSGNNAVIDVNGTQISAKLEGNINLKEGQNVTFTLRSTGDNTLTLSPLFTNLNQQQMVSKALSAANIPITDNSIAVASKLIDAGAPIDKDSLSTIIRAAGSFPEQDVSKLAEMQKYGLDINESNIERFTAFKNYENTVTQGINDIINSVPQTVNELMSSGNEMQAAKLLSTVISTFTGAVSSDGGTAAIVNPNEANAETVSVGSPIKIMQSSDVQGLGDNGESLIREKVVISEDKILLTEEMLNPETDELNEKAGQQAQENRQNFEAVVRVPGQETEKVNIEINTKVADAWQSLTFSDKSAMVDVLKQAGLGENEAKMLLSENSTQTDFLQATQKMISTGNIPDSMRDLIQSDNFNQVLKNQMQAQWLLSPADVSKKENVEELYDRLNQQTKQLTETLSDLQLPNTQLSANLDNMNQNMDFMEQMNQMAQYIQLPLKMNGSEATGDLFVYTDKKSLARNDGNVSALLHLDMKNLGPLDVYASITPGNNVFTKFYLADDFVIDLINDNIHILNDRLEKRGYNMKAETTLSDGNGNRDGGADSAPAVKPAPAAGDRLVAKYSFDAFA